MIAKRDHIRKEKALEINYSIKINVHSVKLNKEVNNIVYKKEQTMSRIPYWIKHLLHDHVIKRNEELRKNKCSRDLWQGAFEFFQFPITPNMLELVADRIENREYHREERPICTYCVTIHGFLLITISHTGRIKTCYHLHDQQRVCHNINGNRQKILDFLDSKITEEETQTNKLMD